MIGNPKWFKYRIFGWGIAPKTWQGWIYLAVAAFLLAGTMAMAMNEAIKIWVFGILLTVLITDVMHIMSQMNKLSDERENYHQLIIERNCSFAAVVALAGIAIFQTYQNKALFQANAGMTALPFDISIALVLGAMLLTKIVSTIYVKQKM